MYADLISGERRLSGNDLARRVVTVAGGLRTLGLGPGDVVCVLMRNDFPFLELALGADRVGLAMVPLNWHASDEELAYIIADCGGKALFAHADLIAKVRDHLPPTCIVILADVPPEIQIAYRVPQELATAPTGILRYEQWLADANPDALPPTSPPYRLTYTSGSTGHPKGVIRMRGSEEQAARLARSAAETHGFPVEGGHAAITAPLYHSAPLAYALTYVRNADLLVLQTKFDAAELLALIARHRISHLYAVATMFSRLLGLPSNVRDASDLSSLKSVVHGAAMCPTELKRAMIAWWGPILSESYAATETALIASCTSAEWLARPGTVGRAAEGVELRVVDDVGRPLSPGETGEILIRSDTNPLVSYLNRPDALDELRRGEWVSMGDVGHLDAEGFLWITDRKRDLVISGGVNIFPAEVERVLLALPEIRDCIVFGIEDADLGEALVALAEPHPGVTPSEEHIRSHLAEQLGRLRVPKIVRFVARLPREDTGKLARRKAKAAYLEGRTG